MLSNDPMFDNGAPERTVLVREIALRVAVSPSGDVLAEILVRNGLSVTTSGRRVFHNQPLNSADVQDLVAELGVAVLDQFIITPGVQLILHD